MSREVLVKTLLRQQMTIRMASDLAKQFEERAEKLIDMNADTQKTVVELQEELDECRAQMAKAFGTKCDDEESVMLAERVTLIHTHDLWHGKPPGGTVALQGAHCQSWEFH